MIDDYLYIAYFKARWKEVTEALKAINYDYSKIKITKGKVVKL